MSQTKLADVQNQIQKYWAPRFTSELRASLLLAGLVSREYKGEIKKKGDTVKVSQVAAAVGENLDVGTNADVFSPEKLVTSYVDIVANKRAVASFEFEDLVDIQSQIDKTDPEVMAALRYGMESQINTYLYSLMSPSSSSPDLIINSVSAFDATTFKTLRKNAGQQKWPKDGNWWLLMDPVYYADLLGVTSLTSSDFVEGKPVESGDVITKRFGFNIAEDNSLSDNQAFAFHPSFMNLVTQTEVQIKVSDLHSNKQFGYVMSVDLIYGAKLAVDGNLRHQKVIAT